MPANFIEPEYILAFVEADHDRIRNLIVDLEISDEDFIDKRKRLHDLTDLTEPVFKAQESVMLSWATGHLATRLYAHELLGKLELFDHLLRAIRLMTNENVWSANVHLFCESVLEYIAAFEIQILPVLFEDLEQSESASMAERYCSYRRSAGALRFTGSLGPIEDSLDFIKLSLLSS